MPCALCLHSTAHSTVMAAPGAAARHPGSGSSCGACSSQQAQARAEGSTAVSQELTQRARPGVGLRGEMSSAGVLDRLPERARFGLGSSELRRCSFAACGTCSSHPLCLPRAHRKAGAGSYMAGEDGTRQELLFLSCSRGCSHLRGAWLQEESPWGSTARSSPLTGAEGVGQERKAECVCIFLTALISYSLH